MINGRLPDYPEPPEKPKHDAIREIISDLEEELEKAIYDKATMDEIEDIISQIEVANNAIGKQYSKPEIIGTGKPVCPYCQTVMYVEKINSVPYWMCECSNLDLGKKIIAQPDQSYPAICNNKRCHQHDDSESGCKVHSVWAADICDKMQLSGQPRTRPV